MKEVTIYELKANCNVLLRQVAKSKQSIRVTDFGKPIADIVPAATEIDRKSWIGSGRGTAKIPGDIVSPVRTKRRKADPSSG